MLLQPSLGATDRAVLYSRLHACLFLRGQKPLARLSMTRIRRLEDVLFVRLFPSQSHCQHTPQGERQEGGQGLQDVARRLARL